MARAMAADLPERPPLAAVGLLVSWVAIVMVWWAIAFYPIGRDAAAWVVRTREVCFGAEANMLPTAYGWIMLIGAPALLLFSIVFTFGEELWAGLCACWEAMVGRTLLAALLALVVMEGNWVAGQIQIARASLAAGDPIGTTALPEGYPRVDRPTPETALVNQRGELVSLAGLRGRPVIVSFVFSHCALVCPSLVTQISLAQQERPEAAVLLITLDPWRDTPSSLAGAASRWGLGPNAHLVSGTVEEVTAALDRWEMPYSRDPKDGRIDHPGLVHVISPTGRISYTFNGPSSAWLVTAIDRIAHDG